MCCLVGTCKKEKLIIAVYGPDESPACFTSFLCFCDKFSKKIGKSWIYVCIFFRIKEYK